MGFFSFTTSDTNESIANVHSHHPTFTVHMITEDGQVFTESAYDGYGVFGDKDFYVLAAELNGLKGKTDEETRALFFDKIWKRGVRKDDKVLTYGIDFPVYSAPIESEGGVCPNDLVSNHGWEYWNVSSNGDISGFVKAGFKMPKLVEALPDKKNWKEVWNVLPYPKSCKYQGYFYDNDNECPYCSSELDNGYCNYCDETIN